ncbi:hypothetical protein [Romboutsia sp. MSSM.1001216sp_RTP31141st1_G3_RTP31141_220114]|uniref:hypothetical protein n=1 Tax=unclassified Romboutsia TaxID=2626894 RepID=UPI0031B59E34
MFTEKDINFLDDIARILLDQGILWGKELEWYIRTSAIGIIDIKDDDHYFELENYVLNVIEKNRKKMIFIEDLKTGNRYIYSKAIYAENKLGIKKERIREAGKKGRKVQKKYLIRRTDATIKDLQKIGYEYGY